METFLNLDNVNHYQEFEAYTDADLKKLPSNGMIFNIGSVSGKKEYEKYELKDKEYLKYKKKRKYIKVFYKNGKEYTFPKKNLTIINS